MSDQFRVMFQVPPGTKNSSKLSSPVLIPVEEYIKFRIGMRDGYNSEMAYYVSKKFLKGEPLSGDDVSMTAAVGNPMYIFEIDAAIDRGENPLEKMNSNSSGQSDEEEKPDTPNALDKFIVKYYPKWMDIKRDTRQIILIFSLVAIIFIILGIWALCSGEKERPESFQKAHDYIESVKFK